jgi:hypothetical protein
VFLHPASFQPSASLFGPAGSAIILGKPDGGHAMTRLSALDDYREGDPFRNDQVGVAWPLSSLLA